MLFYSSKYLFLLGAKLELIYLSDEIAKKTGGYVTIPKHLIPELEKHIENSKPNDLIFSRNNCTPGTNPSNSNLYYKEWVKHVRNKKLTKEPLYSLKDSGITFALDNGVSPVLVMNQARHSDLSITTAYLRKNKQKADKQLSDVDW